MTILIWTTWGKTLVFLKNFKGTLYIADFCFIDNYILGKPVYNMDGDQLLIILYRVNYCLYSSGINFWLNIWHFFNF
jgi:hypothetical protein